MLAAPPVSPDDVISRLIWFLFRLNEGFSGLIEGNPMFFLQYDAINSTFMWPKYDDKINNISVSLINFFIAILYYKILVILWRAPVARVLHMLGNNNYKVDS